MHAALDLLRLRRKERAKPDPRVAKAATVEDRAKIDYRLIQMAAMQPPWPEKWISKYQTTELFEFRITGNRVQYRPFGVYWGKLRYVLLAGAIEKGDKIPRSDVETAEGRWSALRKDASHAVVHQFDDEEDLEGDEE